jgi:membrane protease subunit HflC
VIESEAYKSVQTIKGDADAKATAIYAAAYSQSAEARGLYAFVKTMGTYRKVIAENDTLVLSTESDLYRFLNDASGGAR